MSSVCVVTGISAGIGKAAAVALGSPVFSWSVLSAIPSEDAPSYRKSVTAYRLRRSTFW